MRKTTKKNVDHLRPLIPVSETLRDLSSHKINMGYTGLMYYRNLGLIPPPEKVSGYKERFYNINKLLDRITSIKLTAALFELNFQEIARLSKILPENIFNKLPIAFMKKIGQWDIHTDKIADILFFGRAIFLGGVRETARTYQNKSIDEFYEEVNRYIRTKHPKFPSVLKNIWKNQKKS